MPSHWERRARESRQRSLAAQAARYSRQAPQFSTVSSPATSVVQEPSSQLAARRAQAEARVVEAGRRREAEDAARRPRFALPTGALGPGFQPTAQDYAQAGRMALGVGEEVAFGPERQSVFGGDATRGERTLRDWGLSEQEFRTAGERAGEGRAGAAAFWGALGLAGAVPFVGQAGRGLVKGVTGVARAAGAAADVARAENAAEAWGRVSSPQTKALAETELRSVSVGDSAFIPTVSADGKPRLQAVTRSESAMPADPSTIIPFTPDARLRPLVKTGEEVAPSHVYRVMSREEFGLARERGYIQSAGERNLVAGEGTVFSLRPTGEFYAPASGNGVIVRVRYDDADGWFVGPEGPSYVKTESQVPFDRVDAFEEFGGQAADVTRGVDVTPSPMVFADNIADDYLKEISGPELFSHQKPNIQNVSQERRTVAELAYRQGFEAPPRIVDSQVFDSIVPRRSAVERERLPLQHRSAPDENVLYRGFETQADVNDQFGRFKTSEYYADQLVNGDYYVGHGIRGHGTYFTASPIESLQYAGYSGAQYLPSHSDPQGILGSVVRARIAPEARLLDGFSELTMSEFRNSRFGDISEFAAANGYDGIRYSLRPDKPGLDHVVMLNRSALTFDRKIASVNMETSMSFLENWRNAEKFADSMFSDLPFVIERVDIPTYDLPGGTGL